MLPPVITSVVALIATAQLRFAICDVHIALLLLISQQVRKVGHLSQLVTVQHLVSRMQELMPSSCDKEIAVAALRILQAQNDHDIAAREAGATQHMAQMRQV